MRFRYQKRKHAGRYFITLRKSIVIMEVKIKYKDLIDRCEELSAFEANGKVDANGESRYLELHINEVDEQLIQQYIMQARGILEERIERMIENIEEYGEVIKDIIQVPDTTPVFEYDLLFTRDDLSGYTNDMNSPISSYGSIIYVEDECRFAVPNGRVLYYNLASIGILNDYIEDGTKKVYRLKGSDEEQTWASLYNGGHTGAGLVSFTRGMINQTVERYVSGFTWSIRTTTRWNGIKTFTKHINEAIISYAMAAWLRGKLDDRASFYEGLFNTTLAAAVKNVFTKQVPA